MKTRNDKKIIASFRHAFAVGSLLVILCAQSAFAQALSQPRQEKLLNGLKVLMWSDPKTDKVSVKLRIHAGSAFDPQGKEGLMQMLANNLFPNEAVREFFTDDLGGSLSVSVEYDYIQVEASSTPDKFLLMLQTLSAAVMNPDISKETTDRLREVLLRDVTRIAANPVEFSDQEIARQMFGTFPYGRPKTGTTESLKNIVFTDLVDAQRRFLNADNATLAITGNFDRASAVRAVKRYLGGWSKSDKPVVWSFRQPDNPSVDLRTLSSAAPGIFALRFAIRGPARGDKDVAAATVFSSIVNTRMKALTGQSDIQTDAMSRMLPGMIRVSIMHETDPKTAAAHLAKTLNDPITEAEFKTAKSDVIASRSKVNNDVMVETWLDADTYRISLAEASLQNLNSLTLGEVNVYAERARKQPVASVLLRSTPTPDKP